MVSRMFRSGKGNVNKTANAKLGEENLHYGNEPEGPGATRENPAGVSVHLDERTGS
jgi:hypothetical protein